MDISIKTNELEPIRDQTDLIAELHQKLRAWFLSPDSDENFFENMTGGEEPATPERFDRAMDALPERDA